VNNVLDGVKRENRSQKIAQRLDLPFGKRIHAVIQVEEFDADGGLNWSGKSRFFGLPVCARSKRELQCNRDRDDW